MNFSLEQISLSNLTSSGFEAILFSIFGMAMVFAGLVFISLYIALLPRLLALQVKLKMKKKANLDSASMPEQEVILAIATALHLSQIFPEENAKITWKSHGDLDSPWKITGRVQGLAVRSHGGVNRLRRR